MDGVARSGARAVPPAAAWLGGLGLLPFIAGAALMLVDGPAWASDALRFYAAAILAFMGGIHWGLGIADDGAPGGRGASWIRLGGSVLPALIAWLALLLPVVAGLLVMAAAFVLLLLADLGVVRQGLAPGWYPRLRIPLTALVVACLLAATFG